MPWKACDGAFSPLMSKSQSNKVRKSRPKIPQHPGGTWAELQLLRGTVRDCHGLLQFYRIWCPISWSISPDRYIYITLFSLYTYHLLFFEDHSPQCPSCPNCPSRCTRQVIDQTGHTKSVDWWTLGVLLFELLAGATGGNPPEGGRFLAEELVAWDWLNFSLNSQMWNMFGKNHVQRTWFDLAIFFTWNIGIFDWQLLQQSGLPNGIVFPN